jgi:broad specificity phosphatase PhoE
MSEDGARLLYLARHAEAQPGGSGLTPRGVLQAEHLGRRLSVLPLHRITHGPLARASSTARVVASQFAVEPDLVEVEAAGDYVPHIPTPDEVPDAWADAVLSYFTAVPEQEASRGRSLAAQAVALLVGPPAADRERVDLVITHAFTIGWLVCHALGAPGWRWWGLNHCHAGLTVIRYAPGRPASIVVLNDLGHLPPDLRWTGFPEQYRA